MVPQLLRAQRIGAEAQFDYTHIIGATNLLGFMKAFEISGNSDLSPHRLWRAPSGRIESEYGSILLVAVILVLSFHIIIEIPRVPNRWGHKPKVTYLVKPPLYRLPRQQLIALIKARGNSDGFGMREADSIAAVQGRFNALGTLNDICSVGGGVCAGLESRRARSLTYFSSRLLASEIEKIAPGSETVGIRGNPRGTFAPGYGPGASFNPLIVARRIEIFRDLRRRHLKAMFCERKLNGTADLEIQ
ncbi:hypothetical protein DFP72DRAFT_854956 [Ephemerocybe angulata]|uniref:Uncharacterized protein n=1 Tax=Ephemerocybe angulata TaxID=980116 RepID=A0A8H6HIN6_9AGAR|nr:hypothetical protein DFP72DRAFT_854956 [Tulosesus angulatus]